MQAYQFYFYVPETHLEQVKQAVFQAGAGTQGLYKQCCFETHGQGQFQPKKGSNPYLGQHDELTIINEVKVEMLCLERYKPFVKQALIESHPYEEVAFGFILLVD